MAPTVVSLTIGDDAEAFRAAGFTVEDDLCTVGDLTLRLTGRGGGIGAWTILDPDQAAGEFDVDGLDTRRVAEHPTVAARMHETGGHENGATGVDHVVVSSPDIERTTAAFSSLGVESRRTRDTTAGGAPLRQRFFRMGTIIELIGSPEPDPSGGPARFWGLALVTDDLDVTAAVLGPRLGRVKDAVQPGRRIATLRTRELGISVPIAFMSPHRD